MCPVSVVLVVRVRELFFLKWCDLGKGSRSSRLKVQISATKRMEGSKKHSFCVKLPVDARCSVSSFGSFSLFFWVSKYGCMLLSIGQLPTTCCWGLLWSLFQIPSTSSMQYQFFGGSRGTLSGSLLIYLFELHQYKAVHFSFPSMCCLAGQFHLPELLCWMVKDICQVYGQVLL